MDGRRFDHVTRALASGASRRSVIRAFLALGGAAIGGLGATQETDARTIGSRPTLPPPPPPPPPPPANAAAPSTASISATGT